MRRLSWIVCSIFVLMSGALAQNAPTKPVTQMINAFNTGDVKAMAAVCAPGEIDIVDEVPPFHWHGAKAHDEWLADLEKYEKAGGISDGKVRFGSFLRSETAGDAAYVVSAVNYDFQQKGKAMTESAHMTFVLHKEGNEWKISGWLFSGGKPHAAGAAKDAAPTK